MADSKLLRDRFNVCRPKLEELLTVKLAQPGRKGLLANETQGKGRHGRLQNAGPPMYRLGPWHDDPVTYTTPKVRNARNSASSTFAKRAITSSVC